SVRLDRRRASQDRSVAPGLQSAAATRLARPPDADRVHCPTSGHDHRRCGTGLVTELSRFGTNVLLEQILVAWCPVDGEAAAPVPVLCDRNACFWGVELLEYLGRVVSHAAALDNGTVLEKRDQIRNGLALLESPETKNGFHPTTPSLGNKSGEPV